MKRDRLHLGATMAVETGLDLSGRWFACYARNASIYTRSVTDLRKFLKLPIKTTSRDALEAWLVSLNAMDADREGPIEGPVIEGSWDPEREKMVL
jgi:hypothetical protein